MMVVGVAMIGSLTVLPALMSRLGDKIEKGKIPFLHRLRRERRENRVWVAILTPVLRHPAVSAIAATAVLLVHGGPGAEAAHRAVRARRPARRTYRPSARSTRSRTRSRAASIPRSSRSRPTPTRPPTQKAVAELKRQALASGQMSGPIDGRRQRGHTPPCASRSRSTGEGTDDVSIAALSTLRNEILPATIGHDPGRDLRRHGRHGRLGRRERDAQARSAPLVFGFVLTFAFILLLLSFRSIVIAIKAIVLNLLSVGAAFGVLVATFQFGWGENLLNFQSNGGIAFWLPIFMFVILFGLSMDYHVFILSRIREAYDRGMTTEDAVAHGIKTTAGVVTSAAIVMVGVFPIFATLPIIDMKEMGIGLAAAVLIDATIVRAVLLPATMKLLGDWNWYLPTWLELAAADRAPRRDRAGSGAGRNRLKPDASISEQVQTNPHIRRHRIRAASTGPGSRASERRRQRACGSPRTEAGGDHTRSRRSGDSRGCRESPGPTSVSGVRHEKDDGSWRTP